MNVFGRLPCLGLEVLRNVWIVELGLPKMCVLGFCSKCLGFSGMADEWDSNVLPIIVVMNPPMDCRFRMCKFLELNLLMFSVPGMISINHVFTHAHVKGMMCHG